MKKENYKNKINHTPNFFQSTITAASQLRMFFLFRQALVITIQGNTKSRVFLYLCCNDDVSNPIIYRESRLPSPGVSMQVSGCEGRGEEV